MIFIGLILPLNILAADLPQILTDVDASLYAQVFELQDKEKKSLNVVIRNTGKRNLEITDLQVLDAALTVHLKKHTLKPGGSTKLKVTAYGNQLEGLSRTPRIMIISNDPKHPKMIVNVKVTSK